MSTASFSQRSGLPDRRWRAPLAIGAALALIFLAWQLLDTRNELRSLREEVARRTGAAEAVDHETRQMARSGQDTAQALQGRVSALEARIVDSESQQAALDKLYQDVVRNRDDRGLQDVEQAVSIASQQLQLASNVPAAIAALQSADARLASIAQPRFIALRRLIAQDIERLKALPAIDVGGMSLQIESMLGRLEGLPLAFEHAPQAIPARPAVARPAAAAKTRSARKVSPVTEISTPASAPEAETQGVVGGLFQFLSDFWNDFRQLVRVERLDKPDAALLAPQQASYLRENIRLRLLSARLALLQRDGRVFADDIQQARLWMERYFDTSAQSVANTVEALRQMESARLVVEVPQLNETEAALRRLRTGR